MHAQHVQRPRVHLIKRAHPLCCVFVGDAQTKIITKRLDDLALDTTLIYPDGVKITWRENKQENNKQVELGERFAGSRRERAKLSTIAKRQGSSVASTTMSVRGGLAHSIELSYFTRLNRWTVTAE